MATNHSISDYKIGIICALPLERTAVEGMLDQQHDKLTVISTDNNHYSFGSIDKHNVVIASLPSGSYGTVSAGRVANDMRHSFEQIKWGLMVGIAGGCPRPGTKEGDIRLGDIVIGCASNAPSVVNYRLGKETTNGFDIRSELAEPPAALQGAVSALKSQHDLEGPTYLKHMETMLQKHPRLSRPQITRLYYNHPEAPDDLFEGDSDEKVIRGARFLGDPPTGLENAKFITKRLDGFADYPEAHYGTIASADTLMKSGTQRDAVYQQVKSQKKAHVLCFEMEAAGIVKDWPCLVIRGICDYSDSHKNDLWQNFAAATAAAYAKDLILRIQPDAVERAPMANEVIDSGSGRDQHSNSGSGSMNINKSGTQQISSQIGGSNNKQFNSAGTMNIGGYRE